VNFDSIFVHRYALKARGDLPLNRLSQRVKFEGALIKVDGGFGCIHPWPELGDDPLDQQLLALANGSRTLLTARTLRCCRLDSQARAAKKSLFDGLTIPRSHYSLPPGSLSVPPGFSRVKFKASSSAEAVERIQGLPSHLRVRVDFNQGLSPAELTEFWIALGESRDRIEFIEDPVRLVDSIWNQVITPLWSVIAIDRNIGNVGGGPAFRIVKPAVDDLAEQEPLAEMFDQRLVFTSYMDHPVGQLFAAFEAASSLKRNPSRVVECGLVTHHLFDEADAFVSALGPPVPELEIPSGYGLGFDDLLNNLPWTLLTATTSSC
jgi:O-succinylbenzoate synthase